MPCAVTSPRHTHPAMARLNPPMVDDMLWLFLASAVTACSVAVFISMVAYNIRTGTNLSFLTLKLLDSVSRKCVWVPVPDFDIVSSDHHDRCSRGSSEKANLLPVPGPVADFKGAMEQERLYLS